MGSGLATRWRNITRDFFFFVRCGQKMVNKVLANGFTVHDKDLLLLSDTLSSLGFSPPAWFGKEPKSLELLCSDSKTHMEFHFCNYCVIPQDLDHLFSPRYFYLFFYNQILYKMHRLPTSLTIYAFFLFMRFFYKYFTTVTGTFCMCIHCFFAQCGVLHQWYYSNGE